jgi:hypothetical protein
MNLNLLACAAIKVVERKRGRMAEEQIDQRATAEE